VGAASRFGVRRRAGLAAPTVQDASQSPQPAGISAIAGLQLRRFDVDDGSHPPIADAGWVGQARPASVSGEPIGSGLLRRSKDMDLLNHDRLPRRPARIAPGPVTEIGRNPTRGRARRGILATTGIHQRDPVVEDGSSIMVSPSQLEPASWLRKADRGFLSYPLIGDESKSLSLPKTFRILRG
jgi:hypothetical protein